MELVSWNAFFSVDWSKFEDTEKSGLEGSLQLIDSHLLTSHRRSGSVPNWAPETGKVQGISLSRKLSLQEQI